MCVLRNNFITGNTLHLNTSKFMRKLLLLLLGGMLANGLFGQSNSKLDIALSHLQEKHQSLGLEASDYKDMEINFETTDERGMSYI